MDWNKTHASINAPLPPSLKPTSTGSSTHFIGNVRVDLWRRVACTSHNMVHLSPLEWRLLAYFLKHRGKAQSRHRLLKDVWGISSPTETRAVDLAMHKLRRKIEPEPTKPRFLLTILRKGYLLKKETPS